MPLGTGVYGTNASNAVYYSIASVTTENVISSAKFTDIITTINSERARRGHGAFSNALTTNITASTYNNMISALNVTGPAATQSYNINATQNVVTFPQAPAPSLPATVTVGDNITAAQINNLINSLYNAGATCTCNCNYCTCNCNYCTCNCNYACTCNCNYSDEQLKTNINYM